MDFWVELRDSVAASPRKWHGAPSLEILNSCLWAGFICWRQAWVQKQILLRLPGDRIECIRQADEQERREEKSFVCVGTTVNWSDLAACDWQWCADLDLARRIREYVSLMQPSRGPKHE